MKSPNLAQLTAEHARLTAEIDYLKRCVEFTRQHGEQKTDWREERAKRHAIIEQALANQQ